MPLRSKEKRKGMLVNVFENLESFGFLKAINRAVIGCFSVRTVKHDELLNELILTV